MATTDKKFTVTEKSTSKHPHDWGRAMSVAISRLTDLARDAGDPVHDEALIGEDLHVFVADTETGVSITMSWTPSERKLPTGSGPEAEGTHSAAGQQFDPTGGSTAGLGQ
jgi:hypothetical protein